MRDSRVVLATRGVTCNVSHIVQRPARVEHAGLEAVEPGRGHAAGAQHLGQRHLVEQAGVRDAHQHLVGLARRQEALAEQPVVAREVASASRTPRRIAPSARASPAARRSSGSTGHRTHAPPGRSRRRASRRRQQLRQRPRRRRHAHQADGGTAQFAADQQALGTQHRHAPQHLQQRADHELGFGRSAGIDRPHHLDAGARAGIEVDVLGARLKRPTARSTGA